MDGRACKQYLFRSYNISTFNVIRFDENPFLCQCEKDNKKALKVSNLALLLVVFKRHRGSVRVKDRTLTQLFVQPALLPMTMWVLMSSDAGLTYQGQCLLPLRKSQLYKGTQSVLLCTNGRLATGTWYLNHRP